MLVVVVCKSIQLRSFCLPVYVFCRIFVLTRRLTGSYRIISEITSHRRTWRFMIRQVTYRVLAWFSFFIGKRAETNFNKFLLRVTREGAHRLHRLVADPTGRFVDDMSGWQINVNCRGPFTPTHMSADCRPTFFSVGRFRFCRRQFGQCKLRIK